MSCIAVSRITAHLNSPAKTPCVIRQKLNCRGTANGAGIRVNDKHSPLRGKVCVDHRISSGHVIWLRHSWTVAVLLCGVAWLSDDVPSVNAVNLTLRAYDHLPQR